MPKKRMRWWKSVLDVNKAKLSERQGQKRLARVAWGEDRVYAVKVSQAKGHERSALLRILWKVRAKQKQKVSCAHYNITSKQCSTSAHLKVSRLLFYLQRKNSLFSFFYFWLFLKNHFKLFDSLIFDFSRQFWFNHLAN